MRNLLNLTLAACLCLGAASPALAMAVRKADPSTQPVPAGQRDALYAQSAALYQCVEAKTGSLAVKTTGDFSAFDMAVNSAGNAARNNNNAAFQAEAAIARIELAKLNVKYGC